MSSSIPNTLHSHQCRHCGHIWEHLTLRVAAGVKASQDPAYIEAHRCPGCGAAPTFPFPILSGWRPLPGSWWSLPIRWMSWRMLLGSGPSCLRAVWSAPLRALIRPACASVLASGTGVATEGAHAYVVGERGDSQVALLSRILLPEEVESLLNEKGVVLKNTAMPGARKNAQLCIRQPAGQFEWIDRRHGASEDYLAHKAGPLLRDLGDDAAQRKAKQIDLRREIRQELPNG